MMEDIGLFKQVWRWFYSHKQVYSTTRTTVCCFRDKMMSKIDHHWPLICSGCVKLGNLLVIVLMQWRNCCMRGLKSLLRLGSAALLLIMWSCFLSLTSISCLAYVLLTLGAAGAGVRYLGYSPGLFIVGLFGILILWMYGNFWITGILFIVGGYLFSLDHARFVVLMAAAYAVYSVQARVGWIGIFLSVNLAFLSNDLLNHLLQGCDSASEGIRMEEEKESESIAEDDFLRDFEYSIPTEETENVQSCKSTCKPSTTASVDVQKETSTSQVVKPDTSSVDEMKRIMDSLDHYEALGLPRQLRCWNLEEGVLSDLEKKRNYDEQLRKDRSKTVCEDSHGSSRQDAADYRSDESRRIHCTKCGNSHVWICTNRTKDKAGGARLDCCEHHRARDGDGWVEYGCSLVFQSPPKVEIPRAFVCAESKIFDVSEWAICQGMTCRPNTHRPSFHVNMVGLEKMSRSNSSRFPWDLDAQMMEEDEEEFELWLQQALASGLFSEASKRRKSWSPFKLPQKKYWRKST
ncbi:hypothetical protein MKW92_040731 [Papaver armeniacum]|nr:hypothetical protein MKW92_040731 [Papaver armeniacum]